VTWIQLTTSCGPRVRLSLGGSGSSGGFSYPGMSGTKLGWLMSRAIRVRAESIRGMTNWLRCSPSLVSYLQARRHTWAMQVDLAADDFSVAPWDYPGAAVSYGGVLRDGQYGPLEAIEGRQLVVAVGSNASLAVMHRKFAQQGASTTIPFVLGTVTGLTIGHSAHVSRHGYIAAAPILDPSARTAVVASLLDAEQLECLDRTEPNYDRLVAPDTCRLVVDGDQTPSTFLIYVSKWGVLADAGTPLALMSQQDLYGVLRRVCPPYDALLAGLDFQASMRRFATDQNLRNQTRAAFEQAHCVRPSGFEADTISS
jgi:hypothetical protein